MKINNIPSDLSAENFNSYFINKVDDIVSNLPDTNNEALHFLTNLHKTCHNFKFCHIKVEDVYSTILKLNNSTCLDVFGLNSKILKIASMFICEPLAHIFNVCIDKCDFPEVFKYAKVIPMYKKGDKSDYGNYRPICILPIVSKVFEILLKQQIIK